MAGAIALATGIAMLGGVAVQTLTAPAFADTSAFESFCTNSPIGNLVFNDVVISGTLPRHRRPGQQFSLENFQEQVVIPRPVARKQVSSGTADGHLHGPLEATGATPSSTPTGPSHSAKRSRTRPVAEERSLDADHHRPVHSQQQ